MSSPPPPGNSLSYQTPPPSGGMPKWLIILLVVLLVFMLGCCGLWTACNFMCQAAGTAINTAGQAAAEAARTEIESRIAAQQAALAAQEAAAARRAAPPPLITPETSPSRGGAAEPQPAAAIGRMPANFPTDIPLMAGLTPSIGSGGAGGNTAMLLLVGTTKREDVVAYYTLQMQAQGWSIANTLDAGTNSTTVFSKGTRTARISVQPADDNQTAVTIIYQQ